MYARITTLQGTPESVDAGTAAISDQVFPAVEGLDGFKGMIAFGDRSSGKMMAFTLWETEEAMRASEDAANDVRRTTSETTSAPIVGVERMEVVFDRRM
jgi:hypothetical protein